MGKGVDNKKIDLAIRRQEKKNLREKGHSLSSASMSNALGAGKWIEDCRTGYCIMKDGWRNFIKTL